MSSSLPNSSIQIKSKVLKVILESEENGLKVYKYGEKENEKFYTVRADDLEDFINWGTFNYKTDLNDNELYSKILNGNEYLIFPNTFLNEFLFGEDGSDKIRSGKGLENMKEIIKDTDITEVEKTKNCNITNINILEVKEIKGTLCKKKDKHSIINRYKNDDNGAEKVFFFTVKKKDWKTFLGSELPSSIGYNDDDDHSHSKIYNIKEEEYMIFVELLKKLSIKNRIKIEITLESGENIIRDDGICIGGGGFGKVYNVRLEGEENKRAAVKIISEVTDATMLTNLLKEVDYLKCFSDAGIGPKLITKVPYIFNENSKEFLIFTELYTGDIERLLEDMASLLYKAREIPHIKNMVSVLCLLEERLLKCITIMINDKNVVCFDLKPLNALANWTYNKETLDFSLTEVVLSDFGTNGCKDLLGNPSDSEKAYLKYFLLWGFSSFVFYHYNEKFIDRIIFFEKEMTELIGLLKIPAERGKFSDFVVKFKDHDLPFLYLKNFEPFKKIKTNLEYIEEYLKNINCCRALTGGQICGTMRYSELCNKKVTSVGIFCDYHSDKYEYNSIVHEGYGFYSCKTHNLICNNTINRHVILQKNSCLLSYGQSIH